MKRVADVNIERECGSNKPLYALLGSHKLYSQFCEFYLNHRDTINIMFADQFAFKIAHQWREVRLFDRIAALREETHTYLWEAANNYGFGNNESHEYAALLEQHAANLSAEIQALEERYCDYVTRLEQCRKDGYAKLESVVLG